MLFYQLFLLFGYFYAHFISGKVPPRKQSMIHVGVLLFSLLFMALLFQFWNNPVLPPQHLKPDGNREPLGSIFQVALDSIGFPFLLLSSTSPLLQKWVSFHAISSPYRLYVVSNTGSLLALLTYPILIEPNFSVRVQSITWSAGYLLFTACSIVCASAYCPRVTEIVRQSRTDSPVPRPPGTRSGLRYPLVDL